MLREALRKTWVNNSGPVIAGAKAQGICPVALLRAAEFPVPASLPGEFEVWRAGWGDAALAAQGLSWTLDRWAAFALAGDYSFGYSGRGAPIVVRRTIRREQLVFYHLHRAREVVFDAEPAGVLDGTEAEWRRSAIQIRVQYGLV